MGINSFPGYKPGDIIDLSRFEKEKREKEITRDKNLESYLPFLNDSMQKIAENNNHDFPGFLDSDNRIAISGYDEEIDKKIVEKDELKFSLKENKTLANWQIDKEKDSSNLTEISITILLHKVLGNDFIVARSSAYDDYRNGVDQVIIYKPTGEVVCGIDEVILRTGDADSVVKSEKLQKVMLAGGANVKYGAKLNRVVSKVAEKKYEFIEKGGLVRSEVEHVPAFYMALSKLELGELLENLKNNPNKTSEFELAIFRKLLNSLELQFSRQKLSDDLKIKTESMLTKFRQSLG